MDSLLITPVSQPVRGRIRPPGSKSLTNRALIVAALASGRSRLSGALDSRDTQVMLAGLQQLGVEATHDPARGTVDVAGCGGRPPARRAELFLENSGTSLRFLTALCTLGRGTFRLDGNERMRARPVRDLVEALHALGADVICERGGDCPPVIVRADGLPGGTATVAGDVSSQFLSALLMAAPCAHQAVELKIEGELVSEPYVEMTRRVMASFGVHVAIGRDAESSFGRDAESSERSAPLRIAADRRFRIEPASYRASDYEIEPDASAASYFFAVAAITGGEVTVEGLTRESLQGDVRFIDVLERMGCEVVRHPDAIGVRGGSLRGIDVDMNAISDTAQTLAAVAVFAEGPTRIRNVAHVRHKETDRIAAVATELRRLGQTVEEFDDGLVIHPAPPRPATIETYDDHRMAMSFALVGLRVPGVRIADPGCTAKTYPRFFDDLRTLCGG